MSEELDSVMRLMPVQREVLIDGLGLCEHCGALMTIEDAPGDALDTEWRCPKCEGKLSEKTFGFEKVDGKYQKVRWVGPERKWVSSRPTKNFSLGSWYVNIKHPISPFW